MQNERAIVPLGEIQDFFSAGVLSALKLGLKKEAIEIQEMANRRLAELIKNAELPEHVVGFEYTEYTNDAPGEPPIEDMYESEFEDVKDNFSGVDLNVIRTCFPTLEELSNFNSTETQDLIDRNLNDDGQYTIGKVAFIKELRLKFGLGLKNAKDLAEALSESLFLDSNRVFQL